MIRRLYVIFFILLYCPANAADDVCLVNDPACLSMAGTGLPGYWAYDPKNPTVLGRAAGLPILCVQTSLRFHDDGKLEQPLATDGAAMKCHMITAEPFRWSTSLDSEGIQNVLAISSGSLMRDFMARIVVGAGGVAELSLSTPLPDAATSILILRYDWVADK